MLKKIYEEKTKGWFLILELNSFNDNGDNIVCDYSDEDMRFTNVLTVCTPWTYRQYKLKKNIIDVAFDYKYNGKKWYPSKKYGITITRQGHIHLSWGRHKVDYADVGFFRLFKPWFTSKERTTHKLLNPDGSVYDDNPKCCSEKWNTQPFVLFDAEDYDGELFHIKATLEYSVYTFFKNRFMRFLTKLFKLDSEFHSVNLRFIDSKHGVCSGKHDWKGGVIGTSISKLNKNEPTIDAVKRYCNDEGIILIGKSENQNVHKSKEDYTNEEKCNS